MTTTISQAPLRTLPGISEMLALFPQRPPSIQLPRARQGLASATSSLWELTVRLFRADDDSERALARLESLPPCSGASRKHDSASSSPCADIAILSDAPERPLPRRNVRYALAAIGAQSASLPPGDDPDPPRQSKPLSKLYGRLLPERRARPRAEQLDHDQSHPLTRIFAKHWPERRKAQRASPP